MIKSVEKMTAPVGLSLFAAADATTSVVFADALAGAGMVPLGLDKAAPVIVALPTCVLFVSLQGHLKRFSLGVFK